MMEVVIVIGIFLFVAIVCLVALEINESMVTHKDEED